MHRAWWHAVKVPEGSPVSTPALVVDLDVFESNISAAQALLQGTGKLLRSHFKTHRTSGLALRQLGSLAPGVACATVGEAEVVVAAGIHDVLLANEIVTASKIERLIALAARARVLVAVDSCTAAEALSLTARRAGVAVDVLVDLDVGLSRCGLRSVDAARDLAVAVARAPGLRFAGIMGYEGRRRASEPDRLGRIGHAYSLLAELRDRLEREGLSVAIVSAAGTSTFREAIADPTITEIQAGTYAFMESDLDGLGLPFRSALRVTATVISRAPGRAVLDAGRTSLACDYGLPDALSTNARVAAVSQEHTTLICDGDSPMMGSSYDLRPSHVALTFNLHQEVWLVRGRRVVDHLPVNARGGSS
jgi:3-hydroxy-D-aspartate aldolase